MSQKLGVVVLGDGAVGKSSVTITFVDNYFPTSYDPTIQDNYTKQVTVDGETSFLDIVDTAGQEEFVSLRQPFLRSGEGFLVVYSITDRNGFDEVQKIKQEIVRVQDKVSFPVVLIANKCDLEDRRVISTKEGQELAATFFKDPEVPQEEWSVPFFETSAKNHVNVDEAFGELVRQVRIARQPKPKASPVEARAKAQTQTHTQATPTIPVQAPAPIPKKKKKHCTIL